MDALRFQPPGCRVWIVWAESAPPEGRFVWSTSEEGKPFCPELHVPRDVDRADAFRMAMECDVRWNWVLKNHQDKLLRQEQERQREEEAQARWDEIRAQWEATRRKVRQERAERARPPAASMPQEEPLLKFIPPSIRALALPWPCTAEEVKRAFRERAKELHPDRGGSEAAFIELRQHYEKALLLCAKLC